MTGEFPEVQEQAIYCLSKCAEESKYPHNLESNRHEIAKLGGAKYFIDLLSQEPGDNHHLALQCFAVCLEDYSLASQFIEGQGLEPLVQLIGDEDNKIKYAACLALAKAAKSPESQSAVRELGGVQTILGNLQSADPLIVSASAQCLALLSKTDKVQTDVLKTTVIDLLAKYVSHENLGIRRESLAALSILCVNGISF